VECRANLNRGINMKSTFSCPSCHATFDAEIYDIVDSRLNPDLKQRLLRGQLNVVSCTSCGAQTRIGGPILFHDPEHEMFLIHIPLELNIGQDEREKLIGDLSQRAMNQLSQEMRKGYMLQPEIVVTMQSLIERALHTEGITREMIEDQRAKAKLIEQLMAANGSTEISGVVAEHSELIDEEFFALIQGLLDRAEQEDQEEQVVRLLNLRATLMTSTEAGRRLERRQAAIQRMGSEAKEQNSLSPALLLKHVLEHRDDYDMVDTVVAVGQQALDYSFFVSLSEKIDEQAAGSIEREELMALREHLLKSYDALRERTRKIMEQKERLVGELLKAEDQETSVASRLEEIDESIIQLLDLKGQEAEKNSDAAMVRSVRKLRRVITDQMNARIPPEFRLLNQLLLAKDDEARSKLLEGDDSGVSYESMLALIEELKKEEMFSQSAQLAAAMEKVEAVLRGRVGEG